MSRETRAAGLAFLTAAVTLFVQVLVHRLVSAKLLSNYAFLVISVTMLGFALSGVLLTRWLDRFLARLPDAVCLSAAAFCLALLGSAAAFCRVPVGSQEVTSTTDFLWNSLRWSPLSLLFALPFVPCGLVLGGLLSAPGLSARRVYFFDLLGSALGALVVLPAIRLLGVENSLLVACGVFLGGALLLAPPAGRAARAGLALAGLTLCVATVQRQSWFEIAYPERSMLAQSREPDGRLVIEHTAWDPLARIEVSRIRPPRPERHPFPALIGGNPAFLDRFRRLITQNNHAFTYAVDYDGRRESLAGIEQTIYAAAYQATSVPQPRAMVIGVGGGFDILTALYHEASAVTAVEVNQATVDILTRTYHDYFRHWVDDPRVHLVQDEGRHYLATHPDLFDVIQLSGVDSYSGTPGAAHVFSENYLYTAEAFDLYLSRLAPQGILNVMRLEHPVQREMLRALVTAVAALRRTGVAHPAEHVAMIMARDGYFTALLVKRTPFTTQERERLARWSGPSPFFGIAAGPGLAQSGLTFYKDVNMYQTFLDLDDAAKEAAVARLYPFDITPAEDDRPFFFRFSRWSHLFDPELEATLGSVPMMECSVLALLAATSLTALLCIYLPLRQLSSAGLRVPGWGRYVLYFGGAGLGYLAVEVALLQKFGLFLGHPNYALSVVLASLLLSTGLGALASAPLLRWLGELRFVAYLLAGLVLLEWGLVFPRLASGIGLPFAARCLAVLLLVFPIGLCLGVFMPSGLERLKGSAAPFVPWAWGINGIFSVIAPLLSVAFSMTWGINALLLAAIPVYLVVGWALPPGPEPSPAA